MFCWSRDLISSIQPLKTVTIWSKPFCFRKYDQKQKQWKLSFVCCKVSQISATNFFSFVNWFVINIYVFIKQASGFCTSYIGISCFYNIVGSNSLKCNKVGHVNWATATNSFYKGIKIVCPEKKLELHRF